MRNDIGRKQPRRNEEYRRTAKVLLSLSGKSGRRTIPFEFGVIALGADEIDVARARLVLFRIVPGRGSYAVKRQRRTTNDDDFVAVELQLIDSSKYFVGGVGAFGRITAEPGRVASVKSGHTTILA